MAAEAEVRISAVRGQAFSDPNDSGSHKVQHSFGNISGIFDMHTPESVTNVENSTDLAMGRRPELKSVEFSTFVTLLG